MGGGREGGVGGGVGGEQCGVAGGAVWCGRSRVPRGRGGRAFFVAGGVVGLSLPRSMVTRWD